MSDHPETYAVQVNGVKRDLRLFEVAPGVRIAIVNILGDTELVVAASQALAQKLADVTFTSLITAAAKSIPLIHQLSVDTGKPYVVLRKSYKSYMGDAISATTESITTGAEQTLYLDEKDRALVTGEPVIIIDDVISTGSTLKGIRAIIEKAGGSVAGEAAIFTEGDPERWENIVALGNLPVWAD